MKETAAINKYILLAVENLDSWTVASAIGTNYFNSSGVINFVEQEIFLLYGNPIRILSDSDPKFDNAAVKDYAYSASIDSKIIQLIIQEEMHR